MKKITLFVALVVAPFILSAQAFNFDAAGADFTTWSSLTDNADGTASWSTGTSAATTANVTHTNNFVQIVLKNESSNAYLRVSNLKSGGSGRVYENLDITTNDTEYKTYVLNMSGNDGWDGTENDIKLHIKADAGTNASFTGVEKILINSVTFTSATVEKNSYLFDANTEGWSAVNASGSYSSGKLIVTPTADKFAKITLGGYHIDAGSNSYMHIVLTNNSTDDDEIRVILASSNVSFDVDVSAASKTYDIDLSGAGDWTGNVSNISLGFRDKDNAAGVGKSSGTGTFEIEAITFDNNMTLATDNYNISTDLNYTVYPNPVNELLSIRSKKEISKIEIFNFLGQQIISTDEKTTVDVSKLTPGSYLVKIYNEEQIITKKFIKN